MNDGDRLKGKTPDTRTHYSVKSCLSQMHFYLTHRVSEVKVAQSCLTLCDPMDYTQSLGFSRQEHWSGLPFPSPMHESEKWKKSLSHVWPSATPGTAAYQEPPSMGFSRQEYWSGVPLPSPRIYTTSLNFLQNQEINLPWTARRHPSHSAQREPLSA